MTKRADGWENLVNGLGDVTVDKTLSTRMDRFQQTTPNELRNLYHLDYLTYKIVASLPDDALSLGYEIDGLDEKVEEFVYAELDRLKVLDNLREALHWERLFGGCALWFGAQDSSTGPDSQVREVMNLKRLLWIKQLDRRYLSPRRNSIVDDVMREDYGHAQIYDLRGRGPSPDGVIVRNDVRGIHRSRLVLLKGESTSDDIREANEGWGLSIMERCMQVLRANTTAWLSASYMMSEASYGELKMTGLFDLLAAGQEDAIKDRIAMLQLSKSVARTIVMDSGDSHTLTERSFTGVPDMLKMFMYSVSAASGIPVTKLFGRAAAGMNATGEGDADNWTTLVDGYRTHRCSPALRQCIDLVLLQQGITDAEYEIEYPELQPLDDKERAEVKYKRAQTYEILVRAQLADPADLATEVEEHFGVTPTYQDQE